MTVSASQVITRRSASNLALAFVLLPRDRRAAMAALYAFCREVDDVADEDSIPEEKRRETLERWRKDVKDACEGRTPDIQVNRELAPVIRRFHLPFNLFDELLRGVEMDLQPRSYATYDELEQYCYRVASVVGLLSIEIFGYQNPACRDYAVQLGKALQFTNILRDVGNDAERGRVYLPGEAMQRHGVTPRSVLKHQYEPGFIPLAREFAGRAQQFYQRAASLLPAEDRRSMIAAELMGCVYWRLLRKLESDGFRVLGSSPTRLGRPAKAFLILRTWLCYALRLRSPGYGAA